MKKLKRAFSKLSLKDSQSSNKLTLKPKPPPASQPPQPRTYQHIPAGAGGVFSRSQLGNILKPTAYIGTTATLDTVGVFFEISDTRCFAAHIDAYTTRPALSSPEQQPCPEQQREKHYTTNYHSASLLRSAIIARLDAAVPGEKTQRMRDSLVMTCLRVSGLEARAAELVAKAVREWLGAGLASGGRVAAVGAGFVVQWPGMGRVVFGSEMGMAEGWEGVESGFGAGEWRVGVEEREVEGSEEEW